jgi:hypothetical protein
MAMRVHFWFAAALTTVAATASEPIGNEGLRLTALRTIFPNAQVALEPGRRVDNNWPKKPKKDEMFFPDALAFEPVYRVTGSATNEAERNAAVNLSQPSERSSTREVRVRLFRRPGEDDRGLLAIVQYNFLGANPPLCCLSIGRLAYLSGNAVQDEVLQRHLIIHRSQEPASSTLPGTAQRNS